jgi:lipopolysaccharide export system protein LptC
VTLDWNNQHVRARGMTVRLKDSQVDLEADVHGTVQP